MIRYLCVITFFSLYSSLCIASNHTTLNKGSKITSTAPIKSAALLKQLDKIRKDNALAAYALVITSPQQVLINEIRGYSDLVSKEPAPTDSIFRVGSITKTFVGLSALIAQQQRLLSLQDPVTNHLGPGYYKNPWSTSNPLTIIHLLEQTSGLPDMSKEEFDFNKPTYLESTLKQFSHSRQLQWAPGQFFSYSNTNYGLIGRVLEKATQLSIDKWLTKSIFKPLSMNSATLQWNSTIQQHLIPGYDSDGKTPIKYWHMVYPSLGAINLKPSDMAAFLQMFLNNGRYNNKKILPEYIIKQFETPHSSIAARSGSTYGYGTGIYNWFVKGHPFYGHGGDGDGYLAHFAYQRDINLAYFIVINAYKKPALQQMRNVIEQHFIEHLPKVAFLPKFTLVNPQQFVGHYSPVTWRFGQKPNQDRLSITYQKGKLLAQFNGEQAYILVPVSKNQFRWQKQPKATISIVQTKNGSVFISDDGNFIRKE